MQKSIFCLNDAESVRYANLLKVGSNKIYIPLNCNFLFNYPVNCRKIYIECLK